MDIIGTLVDIVDPHVHARDLIRAKDVLPYSALYCSYILLMPNVPPLINGDLTMDYTRGASKIIAGYGCGLIPCMMLDDETTPEMIKMASRMGVRAAKLYPKGATTRDETVTHIHGVSDIQKLLPTFKAMEEEHMTLNLHGEVATEFVLYREEAFLHNVVWLNKTLPELDIVLEHITTQAAVQLIQSLPPNVVATITAHHLLDTLDIVLGDKVNVHAYCKPVHKLPEDRGALQGVVINKDPKFFFGSDSAPHAKGDKECAHGCAGAFTAPHAIQLVITALVSTGMSLTQAVETAQTFVSDNARRFYRLPRLGKRMAVTDTPYKIPTEIKFGDVVSVPYRAGGELPVSLAPIPV